jgi:hypothetical protein
VYVYSTQTAVYPHPLPLQLCVQEEEKELMGWGGGGQQQQGVGTTDNTQGDRNWSSLGRHKDKLGLSVIIHILCTDLSVHFILISEKVQLDHTEPHVQRDPMAYANPTRKALAKFRRIF